jgi:Fuc2NAc and GlcNAc transferase
MYLIVLAAACFIAAATGVAAFTRWAARARLLDVPNARSSHQVPTPRGAGAVIVLVVAAAMGWASDAGLFHGAAVALAALIVAVVSAVDDVRPLPSWLRLLVHLTCAVASVIAIARGGTGTWTLLAIALGVVWMVGLTNAYNFMDGIDGISGVQAIVAGVTITVASLHVGLAGLAVAGVAIASSSAGFLLHNWPPARVFMGDVGSAFLGFSFAAIALEIGTVSLAAGIAVMLSLWPFVFDTAVTLLRRIVRRENIFASHRSHLYQRLVIAGCTHARVTLLYAAMAAGGAAAGYAWAVGAGPWPVLISVPIMALAIYSDVMWSESAAASRTSGRGDADAAAR